MNTLTPAPELDAVFDEPPTVDEWRAMAVILAAVARDANVSFLRGVLTSDDFLRQSLAAVRERRPG